MKVHNNFIEIRLPHGCSSVNLLHICRTVILTNTYGGLLLQIFIDHACHILQYKCRFFHTSNSVSHLDFALDFQIQPEFNFVDPAYRVEGCQKVLISSNHRGKITRSYIRRSWRSLCFMIQGSNMIGKHFMKPMA